MAYIFVETQQYPLYIGDIQLLYPDATEANLPNGFTEVLEVEKPETTLTHYPKEIAPIQISGVWTQQFQVKEFTADELAARETRAQERMAFINNPNEMPNPDRVK
jgi:hypothetical protein